MNQKAYLILSDGSLWKGVNFGAPAPDVNELESNGNAFKGEVIFNTGMTGYHEILTDPSYTGQIVLMTYPHIGNYGDIDSWSETGPEKGRTVSRKIKTGGLIVRFFYDGPVPEGRKSLDSFLKESRVCGISGVDTRALTLKIRREGSRNGIIVSPLSSEITEKEVRKALEFIDRMPSMNGLDLTGYVGTAEKEIINPGGSPNVVLLDCGVKKNIINELTGRGCKVTLLPSGVSVKDVIAEDPDALLLSNGPGDPEPLKGPENIAKTLFGKIPLWGICLGHQVLSQAAGGKTYKMPFGHHGVNHPVTDEKTGRVFVTSQNHGFAVKEESLPDGFNVRFRNANDGSVEGIENSSINLLCVQHHPEASPGPVDSGWVFDTFLETLKNTK